MHRMAKEGVLLGYGNPLLDIQVVATEEFLNKYDLKANNAILAEDKHKPMYKDMIATFKEVLYVPGGATLNAIKVAQWLINVKNATTFFGCVNKDTYGNILEEKAREMGVNMKLQITDKEPTGTCAVIVTGENSYGMQNNRFTPRKFVLPSYKYVVGWSLCANLAAANCFTEDHLDNPDNWSLVEKADYFYCAGFPLTVSPSTVLRLAKHAHKNGKAFCMNMSAPFLCQFFKTQMLRVFPYADVVFGNETEAATFATENNLGTDKIPEIALKMAGLEKENEERARIVVITQGELPVIVAQGGKVEEFPVLPVKPENIVDTNGAGDAFVGGFLAQFVQRKPVAECVRCGIYAANLVIQRSGCTVPDKPDFS